MASVYRSDSPKKSDRELIESSFVLLSLILPANECKLVLKEAKLLLD